MLFDTYQQPLFKKIPERCHCNIFADLFLALILSRMIRAAAKLQENPLQWRCNRPPFSRLLPNA